MADNMCLPAAASTVQAIHTAKAVFACPAHKAYLRTPTRANAGSSQADMHMRGPSQVDVHTRGPSIKEFSFAIGPGTRDATQ